MSRLFILLAFAALVGCRDDGTKRKEPVCEEAQPDAGSSKCPTSKKLTDDPCQGDECPDKKQPTKLVLKLMPETNRDLAIEQLKKRNRGFWIETLKNGTCESYFSLTPDELRYQSAVVCMNDNKPEVELESGIINKLRKIGNRYLFGTDPLLSTCLAEDQRGFRTNRARHRFEYFEMPHVYQQDFDNLGSLELWSTVGKIEYARAVAIAGVDTKFCEDVIEFPEAVLSRGEKDALVKLACDLFDDNWQEMIETPKAEVNFGCFDKDWTLTSADIKSRKYDESELDN